jgi:hypothetical protein
LPFIDPGQRVAEAAARDRSVRAFASVCREEKASRQLLILATVYEAKASEMDSGSQSECAQASTVVGAGEAGHARDVDAIVISGWLAGG